jgi:hypothetical protein
MVPDVFKETATGEKRERERDEGSEWGREERNITGKRWGWGEAPVFIALAKIL